MTKDEFMQIHTRHRQICRETGEPFNLVDVIDQLEQEFGKKLIKEYLRMIKNMRIS